MQPSNGDQKLSFHDQVWVLLIETSLGEFLSDHDQGELLMAGALFQKMRELGMSLENLKSIDRMLADFAKEALLQFQPGSLESTERIRIFCQQEMIDTADSTQTARMNTAEQVMEPAQKIHPSGTIMSGGWGCFLVKRGVDVSGDASLSSIRFVDLYLYREG